MLVLASRFGPSDTTVWIIVLALTFPAAVVGFLLRSPSRGLKFGGLTSAVLTFLWLACGTGQAIFFAAILTPFFAIIGGLVGCFFGGIGRLVWGDPPQPRQRIAEQTHFEFRGDSESEPPLNQQQADNEQLPGPDSERDAV